MAKDEKPISFSPREMEVLALAWQCMETEPKIDIDKLANLTGYTRGSASVTFGNIKRKLKLHAAGIKNASDTPNSTPKKNKTPKSASKRAAPASSHESPAKKTKSGAAKKAPTREAYEGDDEEFKDVRVKQEEAGQLLRGMEYYGHGQGHHGQGHGQGEVGYAYGQELQGGYHPRDYEGLGYDPREGYGHGMGGYHEYEEREDDTI